MDDMDKLLDAMGDEMDDDDLDAMLKALMEEESESTWVPSSERVEEEPEPEPEPEPEIFEYKPQTDEAQEDDEEKKPKRNLFKVLVGGALSRVTTGAGKFKANYQQAKENNPKLRKIMLGLFGGVALVGIGVVVLLLITRANNLANQPHFITAPNHAFNNANSEFVSIALTFPDHSINLSQILLDPMSSIFYFHGHLDLSRYEFTLVDEGGRVYLHDRSFAESPARQQFLYRTAIRFEGLCLSEELVTLSVTDLESGREASVTFAYSAESINTGRFFNSPIEFYEQAIPGLTVSLTHAHFSASGSSIGIGVQHSFADGGIVFKTMTGASSPIGMRHRFSVIPALGDDVQGANLESGMTHVRMDFVPLVTLSGDVDISVEGMFRHYERSYSVPVSEIITTAAQRPYPIALSNSHRITIQGIMRQGYHFVMPMFGENIATNSRMATTIEASLVGVDANGQEQRVVGRVTFDDRGTDVLFDTRQNPAINYIANANLRVEVESASIRLPRINHSLNLLDGSRDFD